MKIVDLSGQKFGKLYVLRKLESLKGKSRYLCQCDCGKEKVVTGSDLTSGNTKTCGCGRLERIRAMIQANTGRTSSKLIDLTGLRFGRWCVLGQKRKSKAGQIYWLCRCECGKEKEVSGFSLRSGQSLSCGCIAREKAAERCRTRCTGKINPAARDLTGRRFGRLTVLHRMPLAECKKGKVKWECKCDCGKISYPVTSDLLSGKTTSCGCLGLEHATQSKIKHGMTHTPLYNIWCAMRNRCYRKKTAAWPYYGGKGIQVCESWRMSFEAFYAWAKENGYKEGLSIDRINADKDYCPENCRWITKQENLARVERFDSDIKAEIIIQLHAGVSHIELSKKYHISEGTLSRWTKKEGIHTKVSKYLQGLKDIVLCMKREGMTTIDILEISGIGETTFHNWVKDKK